MNDEKLSPGEEKTRRQIIKLLKTEGPLDATSLAARLGVSAMAVRQHLYALRAEKLVKAEERAVPVGRPAKHWRLARDAHRLFPDASAELSVSLINAAGEAFGAEGINLILETRSAGQRAKYAARIPADARLPEKLEELARIRTEEGYMAETRRENGGAFLLIENHCPICDAATACQGFCQKELELFQSTLGPEVSVERVEHILAGNRRCVYRVRRTSKGSGERGAPSEATPHPTASAGDS